MLFNTPLPPILISYISSPGDPIIISLWSGDPTLTPLSPQVTHGGLLSEPAVMLDDIRSLRRDKQPPEEGVMCDLLWSDPQDMVGVVVLF